MARLAVVLAVVVFACVVAGSDPNAKCADLRPAGLQDTQFPVAPTCSDILAHEFRKKSVSFSYKVCLCSGCGYEVKKVTKTLVVCADPSAVNGNKEESVADLDSESLSSQLSDTSNEEDDIFSADEDKVIEMPDNEEDRRHRTAGVPVRGPATEAAAKAKFQRWGVQAPKDGGFPDISSVADHAQSERYRGETANKNMGFEIIVEPRHLIGFFKNITNVVDMDIHGRPVFSDDVMQMFVTSAANSEEESDAPWVREFVYALTELVQFFEAMQFSPEPITIAGSVHHSRSKDMTQVRINLQDAMLLNFETDGEKEKAFMAFMNEVADELMGSTSRVTDCDCVTSLGKKVETPGFIAKIVADLLTINPFSLSQNFIQYLEGIEFFKNLFPSSGVLQVGFEFDGPARTMSFIFGIEDVYVTLFTIKQTDETHDAGLPDEFTCEHKRGVLDQIGRGILKSLDYNACPDYNNIVGRMHIAEDSNLDVQEVELIETDEMSGEVSSYMDHLEDIAAKYADHVVLSDNGVLRVGVRENAKRVSMYDGENIPEYSAEDHANAAITLLSLLQVEEIGDDASVGSGKVADDELAGDDDSVDSEPSEEAGDGLDEELERKLWQEAMEETDARMKKDLLDNAKKVKDAIEAAKQSRDAAARMGADVDDEINTRETNFERMVKAIHESNNPFAKSLLQPNKWPATMKAALALKTLSSAVGTLGMLAALNANDFGVAVTVSGLSVHTAMFNSMFRTVMKDVVIPNLEAAMSGHAPRYPK